MLIEFTEHGWEEFSWWIENDPETVEKINEILKSIIKTPFSGLGKPEPLKHDLKGYWSRRITGEHRLVYRISGTKVSDQKCSVIQCRFHY
jgi:toxin YoeB